MLTRAWLPAYGVTDHGTAPRLTKRESGETLRHMTRPYVNGLEAYLRPWS